MLCILSCIVWNVFSSSFYVPMQIYWNINYDTWIDIAKPDLLIFDSNGFLIKKISLVSKNKYWSDEAFDLDNKILLDNFNWKLKFKLKTQNNLYQNIIVSLWTWSNCNQEPIFQQWKICEYDLFVKNIKKTNYIPAPSNLQVIFKTDNKVYIKWNTVHWAVKYKVYYNNFESYTDDNVFMFTWLQQDTKYKFYVQSIWNNDLTWWISYITVKTNKILSIDEIFNNATNWNINDLSKQNLVETTKDNVKEIVPIIDKVLSWTSSIILTTEWLNINQNKINKSIVLLPKKWNKVEKNISVLLPKNIKILNSKNVKIQPPIDLSFKKQIIQNKIKEKINVFKKLDSVLEIPTSTWVKFDGYVILCVNTNMHDVKKVKIYYSQDWENWQKDKNAKDITINNWKLCFKTNHFTQFAIGEEQSSSSSWSSSSGWGSSGGSSYHSWWGGWGWSWGWYVPTTKSDATTKKTTKTVKKTLIKTVTLQTVNKKLSAIKFKTKKFQVASKLLNKLAVDIVITSKLLLWEKSAKKMFEEYYEVLKWLSQLEAKELTKTTLKKKVKVFLKEYVKYQKEFKKVVKEEEISVKGENVELYKVSYKSNKLSNVVNNVLDNLIVKELIKAKYTKENVKNFYEAYNKFKLAVRYMKEINKTEGKKLAKEYVKKMLGILNK